MAYQLPPPPPNDDPKTRAWLYELYKRNQDILDNAATVELTGDVTGGPGASTNSAFSIATTINLPNVTEIDGGASDTNYAAQDQGPYGVLGGGGGSALEVEDDGTSLSTAVTKLNFVGLTLTQPVSDEITITYAPTAAANSQWAPGYNYSQVSTTAFTADLVRATNLFRVGRRIKFGSSGTYTYGVIASSDFDTTAANDTYVSMTMEGTDTIPATIDELYLVSSDTAWSPIASDPFSSTAIRNICTGVISGTQWWVAVGDSGKLYTSTDAGVTWTSRTSGTTTKLRACTYNSVDERFWVGGEFETGDDMFLAYSDDGSTWTETASYTSATSDYISDLQYNLYGDFMIMCYYDNSASQHQTLVANTTDWSSPTLKSPMSVSPGLIAADGTATSIDTEWYAAAIETVYYWDTYGDPSPLTLAAYGNNVTAVSAFGCSGAPSPAKQYIFTGLVDGTIYTIFRLGTSYSSGTEFSAAIRDFARSEAHTRTVCVGDSGAIGYIDDADIETANSWTSVANGFSPSANVLCVAYNETDAVWVACADNGQICRSSNGIT